jgi:hypothetical protein
MPSTALAAARARFQVLDLPLALPLELAPGPRENHGCVASVGAVEPVFIATHLSVSVGTPLYFSKGVQWLHEPFRCFLCKVKTLVNTMVVGFFNYLQFEAEFS